MDKIAILIPTLRRPDSLTRTLRSLFAQDVFGAETSPLKRDEGCWSREAPVRPHPEPVEGRGRGVGGGHLALRQAQDEANGGVYALDHPALSVEIVVIDNSPEASVRTTVDALTAASPIPLIYVHAPQPGVATARNAGLAATTADQIVFIDDDEEAPPGWLATLIRTHTAFKADVTFGPVQGVAAQARPSARAYLDRFFSRLGPAQSGLIAEVYGCGNSMMNRATALAGAEPFDTAADDVGGEDDRLFTVLKARGARFAWAADAFVYEHAPRHRATMRYALKRAFAYGQSPCQICLRAGDRLGVAKWMLIGAGQVLVYGAITAALWIARRPQRYAFADKTARGLGKVVWISFLRFYGSAEARRTSRTTSGAAPGMASRTASRVKITQSNSL